MRAHCIINKRFGLLSKHDCMYEAIKNAEVLQQQQGNFVSKTLAHRLLRECMKRPGLEYSRQIQSLLIHSSLDSVEILANHLIRLYASCGSLLETAQTFNKISKPSAHTWSAIITSYVKLTQSEIALQLYDSISRPGVEGNKYVYIAVLQACSAIASLVHGRILHRQIIEDGLRSDIFLGSKLIDMYAKCGSLKEACDVFDNVPNQNVVSWGAMVAGYVQHGDGLSALDCFGRMHHHNTKPDKVIFLSILKACANISAIEHGRSVHQQILEFDFQADVVIGSALIDMYAKSGKLDEAHRVFNRLSSQNVVSWGAMIAAYAQHGQGHLALEYFDKMQQDHIIPDKVTFLSVLKACGTIEDIERGQQVHEQIVKYGFESDIFVGNMLVDMYSKCGRLEKACKTFENLATRDVVAWNIMIAGYCQNDEGGLALKCFEDMQQSGRIPDKVTFLSVLKACGSIGAIEQGRELIHQIIERGYQHDVSIGNTLVDMYGRCGCLEEADKVFHNLSIRDVVSWNAMIAACAHHRNFELVLQYFEAMQDKGVKADAVTFLILLGACSDLGLIDQGFKFFISMKEDHGILPNTAHFAGMVDLLSQSGHLTEADNLQQTIESSIGALTSLLAACKKYGNMDLGRQCFDQIVQIEPQYAPGYLLMAGIYSDAHMVEEAANVERIRQCICAWKKPAKAWIEVNNKIHEFVVGDKRHPQSEEIYDMLKGLKYKMRKAGYAPTFENVSQQMLEEQKEYAFCGHCEKLAVAFGLLMLPSGVTIRATKNLRMCVDCHSTMRIISKVEKREVVIRDTHRAHYFKDGACCCGDYDII